MKTCYLFLVTCYRQFIVCCLVLIWIPNARSQDIEAVAKAPILAANGGVSLSQITTFVPGDQAATPYSYYLSGNLNLNFFSVVSVPLSFAYTNQQLNSKASLPFNRLSIAPSYKWIKVYAGYSTMYFSPYTLSGHEICGGGVELTPDIGLKVSAVYGRLRKTIDEAINTPPSYQCMGGGLKVEYTGKAFDIGVNVFKAEDDPTSVRFINPDSIQIAPQDNLSGSVYVGIKLIENLAFNTEYAMSGINRNTGGDDSTSNKRSAWLLDTSGDMAVYHALKSQLTYQSPIGMIGATYERVAPNYTTLGAYCMVNDFENITANFSTSIKNIQISIDGGYQHDNLEEQKTNTTSRMIFSGNISTTLGKKLSLGANLSNIQSYVNIRDVYDQITQTNQFQNLDTLNFTQLNYTASLNAGYVLQSTQQQRQSINANFMYQKAAEKQENTSYAGNDIYNSALAWQYAQIPRKLNISASVNYNHNQMPGTYTGTVSTNLSLQKVYWEKLQAAIICTYSNMFNPDNKLADIVNLRITGGYTIQKKHNFNLSLAVIHNDGQGKTTMQYSANLAYSYIFSFSLSRKDKKLTTDMNF